MSHSDLIEHCSECVDLLGDYVDGSLPPDRAKALELHLSQCMPCITFVRTYKATRSLCRGALEREMPRELMAALQSFLGKHVPGFAACGKRSDGKSACGGDAELTPPAAPAAESKKG